MKIYNTTSLVILAVALAATCSLFALFAPEKCDALFFVNLFWTLALEILGIGAVFVVSQRRFFSVQGIAIGLRILRFCVCGTILFAVYNLPRAFVADFPIEPRWYYAAMIALAAFFTVEILFLAQGAAVQQKAQKAHENRVDAKRESVAGILELTAIFRDVSAEKSFFGAKEKQDAERAICVFSDAVSRIPASEFSAVPALRETVSAEREKIVAAMNDLRAADGESAARDALSRLGKIAGTASVNVRVARGR